MNYAFCVMLIYLYSFFMYFKVTFAFVVGVYENDITHGGCLFTGCVDST